MSLLQVTDLTVAQGGRTVLSAVSMGVERGEIVTIVGPNGSGKSSLLRAIVGGLPVAAGQVSLSAEIRIGYVPQTLHIDATLPLTVDRFLNLPVRSTRQARQAVLERVGAQGLAARQMSQLSGGQFQRVLLARALLSEPDLLILDEPTQGLDQPGSADFYELIDAVRRESGCGILMVSHDLHVVMSATDRVICLNGHVCCQGTPKVVTQAPEYRALFGYGTRGALALYRHEHDHSHEPSGAGDPDDPGTEDTAPPPRLHAAGQ